MDRRLKMDDLKHVGPNKHEWSANKLPTHLYGTTVTCYDLRSAESFVLNIKSFTESFKSEVWKREQKLITSNIATGTGQTRFYQFLTNDSHGKLISPWYMRNIDRNSIKTLTQFRLHSNNLAIVKDAWRGVAIENRLCTNCHQIVDEVHFISECKLLEGLRRKYLPEYIRQSRNTVNTINLLRS